MVSSSDQQPTSLAASVLVFLTALPLMVVVTAVFVSSIELKEDRTPTAVGGVDPEKPANAEKPSPVLVATKAPPTMQTSGSEGSEQSPSLEVKAEASQSPEPIATVKQGASSQAKAATGDVKTELGGEAPSTIASRGILVEELSKETYSVLTELQAVLESKAWDDAARLVTSLDPATASGVAPYFNDRALLTSLPVAVQLAREDYPQLQQLLTDKLAPLAKLRVTQAISAGDAATLRLAAVQFSGTPAAFEAHRWLGDRALMRGQFAKAIVEYKRGQSEVSSPNEEIGPRIRLAAAMLGRSEGQPVKQSVRLGEITLSPAKFEALVAEMRDRSLSSADIEPIDAPIRVPPPSGFEAHVRSRLDGSVGERPQDDLGRRTNQLRIPWADRQIATVVEDDMLYVANRFQVAAYKLSSGERVWQSQPPPGQMQRAQEWGLIPMRPLVTGDRIYVRLLYSASPLLVCLEKSSGKLIWVGESRENEFLVSDPVILDGQLVALSVLIQPDQHGLLRYNVFDRRSGEIVQVHDLIKLRSTWGVRACCEILQIDDGLVVVLGGVVLVVDDTAHVRWIRTQSASSPDDNRPWVEQMFQRPIVRNGRLCIAQPGVRTVECLAAATGRQHWSVALPEVIGIIGITDDLLVVRTIKGVCGIDLTGGTARWQLDAEELCSFQLVDNKRLLLASRERIAGKGDQWQPRLSWIDPADGKRIATTAIASLADSDPRLGPLIPYRDRLFTLFGRGQHDATRDLFELIAKDHADSVP